MSSQTAIVAYLDAGSGSVILQALLGGAAAAAVVARLWWDRILRLLRIRKPLPDDQPPAGPAPAPPPAGEGERERDTAQAGR